MPKEIVNFVFKADLSKTFFKLKFNFNLLYHHSCNIYQNCKLNDDFNSFKRTFSSFIFYGQHALVESRRRLLTLKMTVRESEKERGRSFFLALGCSAEKAWPASSRGTDVQECTVFLVCVCVCVCVCESACVHIWMCTSSCRHTCAVVHSLHTCDVQGTKLQWCSESKRDTIKDMYVYCKHVWYVQFCQGNPGPLTAEWGISLWEAPSGVTNQGSSATTTSVRRQTIHLNCTGWPAPSYNCLWPQTLYSQVFLPRALTHASRAVL